LASYAELGKTAISETTWTLALSGKDIKQKAQLLLAFQRLA
jgi:hypothetical protein